MMPFKPFFGNTTSVMCTLCSPCDVISHFTPGHKALLHGSETASAHVSHATPFRLKYKSCHALHSDSGRNADEPVHFEGCGQQSGLVLHSVATHPEQISSLLSHGWQQVLQTSHSSLNVCPHTSVLLWSPQLYGTVHGVAAVGFGLRLVEANSALD
jgi:hypothetical protein